jgi:hypothetical protein
VAALKRRAYRSFRKIVVVLAAIASCGCEPTGRPSPSVTRRDLIARESTPWKFGPYAGERIRTAHYEIFSTVPDRDYNAKLAATMEAALLQYGRVVPIRAPADQSKLVSIEPMKCYVFSNRVQFEAFTRLTLGEDADQYLLFNRGGYTVGDVFASHYAGDGTIQTAAHEGLHQYLHRRLKDALPPFLEEGLATMFENVTWSNTGRPRFELARNDQLSETLADAVEQRGLVPLQELARLHAGEVVDHPRLKREVFYAQSWAFARFLVEAGGGEYRDELDRMIADAAMGKLYDPTGATTRAAGTFSPGEVVDTLGRYLGAPLEQIDAEYQMYVRSIAKKRPVRRD